MLIKIVRKVMKLNPSKIVIVVGKYENEIRDCILNNISSNDIIQYVHQPQALGTGNAVKHALNILDKDGINMIINGDTPFIKTKTLKDIIDVFKKENEILVTGINIKNPFGYGRIESDNNKARIVEESMCTEKQKSNTLVNTGIYVTKTEFLAYAIPQIQNTNHKGEYFLTDILKFSNSSQIHCLEPHKIREIFNINTKDDLMEAEIINK